MKESSFLRFLTSISLWKGNTQFSNKDNYKWMLGRSGFDWKFKSKVYMKGMLTKKIIMEYHFLRG